MLDTSALLCRGQLSLSWSKEQGRSWPSMAECYSICNRWLRKAIYTHWKSIRGVYSLHLGNFWEFINWEDWKLLSTMRCGLTLRLCAAEQFPSPSCKGSTCGWHSRFGPGKHWSQRCAAGQQCGYWAAPQGRQQPSLSLSHLSFPSFQCKSINRKISS